MEQQKSIIVFDGICSLCNNFILFVVKRDVKDHFRFISLQNPNLRNYIIDSNELDFSKSDSILLIYNGTIKTKADAIAIILSELKGFKTFGILMNLLPRQFNNLFYSFIAKHRYKLFGTTESCSIIEKKLQQELYKKKILI